MRTAKIFHDCVDINRSWFEKWNYLKILLPDREKKKKIFTEKIFPSWILDVLLDQC